MLLSSVNGSSNLGDGFLDEPDNVNEDDQRHNDQAAELDDLPLIKI